MDFSNKRILVTGGAGYIGSHFCLALAKTKADVAIVDNLSTGFNENIHYGTLHTIDLNNKSAVNNVIATFKPDAVIHFAGSIVVPESVKNPLKYYSNNTKNALNLIESCLQNNVHHVLFSSTAAVYGTPNNGICQETNPLLPINPYGRSKLMTEMMLDDISKATNLNYVALRYFNVAGAHSSFKLGQRMPDATHLIKIIAQVITKKRDKMAIFGTDYNTSDGTCIRDYIHVCDLAQAHLLALDYLFDGGQSNVFNCGYSKGFSVKEVIDKAQALFGNFTVDIAPKRDGDPAELIADAAKIKQVLQWKPKHNNLEEIIKTAVEFERLI